MLPNIRLLILEDSPEDAELIERELHKAKVKFSSKVVETKASFINELDNDAPDLILCDYSLPDFDGMSAIKLAQKVLPDVPIIIVSGSIGEELAAECIKEGAVDYILKDNLTRLSLAIVNAIELSETRTDKNNALSALVDSEEKYRTIFTESKEAIYISNRAGDVVEVNPACSEMFGYSEHELLNMKMVDLYLAAHDREKLVEKIENEGFVRDYDISLKKKDGTVISCIDFTNVRRSQSGEVVGYQGMIQDVSDRKKAEKEIRGKHKELLIANADIERAYNQESALRESLIRAQRLASLGDMASKIAHEINNPLTVIMGHTDLMPLLGSLTERQEESLSLINENSLQLRDLTRKYMNLGKSIKSDKNVTKLSETLRSTLASLKPLNILKNVELNEKYSENEPEILGDAVELEQVFMNLVLNAVDAIASSPEKILSVGTNVSKNGKYVEAFVSDTGEGIAAEKIDQIFETFFTSKEEESGTGLGLAISKEIVETRHNGKIMVESTQGKGTTLRILIPIHQF